MNESQTCSKCSHYKTQGGGAGQCWGSPPTPLLIGLDAKGHPMITSARAPVPGNTPACGQFKQKFVIQSFAKLPEGLPPMPDGGKV